MRLLNIGDKLINLKNKLKLKNAVSIAAAVMLGVTSLAAEYKCCQKMSSII